MIMSTASLAALVALFEKRADYIDVVADERGWDAWSMSRDKTSMLVARVACEAPPAEGEPLGRFEAPSKDLAESLKSMGAETDARLSEGGARLSLSGGGLEIAVPLAPAPSAPRRIPSLPLQAGFVCDPAPLRKVASLARCGLVRLSLGPGGLEASSLDESACGPTARIAPEEAASMYGEASASYSADVLASFLSRFPKGSLLSAELGTSLPLRATFASGALEGALLLAPVVEEALRCRASRS